MSGNRPRKPQPQGGAPPGSATYTGNMRSELTQHGWAIKQNDGHPQAGDILLNDRDHTAVSLGSNVLAQASINEEGGITGGQPGNQTNGETNVSKYYDFPWDCYLRYPGPHAAPGQSTSNVGRCRPATTSD
jgi:hypothetical protein